MSEHEMLKEICDTIMHAPAFKYKPNRFNAGLYIGYIEQVGYEEKVVDVREIIFTQEFMDKLLEYCFKNKTPYTPIEYMIQIMHNLDDPVSYLYNLLGLGVK